MARALLKAVSWFSFLRGILSPEALCRRAKELGYDAVALTDRDNLCGLPEFLHCCRRYDLRPIIGAEITEGEKCVLLYSSGDQGYTNLCRVITERHCSKEFSLARAILSDPRGLSAATDNPDILLALSGCMPSFFWMKRPIRPPEEVRALNLPCLVLPESVFISPEDYHLHKLLRAIALNTTMSGVGKSELFLPDSFILPWPDMCRQFEAFPQHLRTTEEFSNIVQSRQDFGALIFPRLYESKESAHQILRAKAMEGAKRRFGVLSRDVIRRLDYELEIISQKGFDSYFLIVDDIVRQSPRTCGRGSGAASLVAYCLGITNVDPLRHKLMFERFLNPGRNDPPDLDIDFAWDERDHVLAYVFKHYGLKHVAMVANHFTFQPRSALRETARVYGLPEVEISRVTKKITWYFHMAQLDGHVQKERPDQFSQSPEDVADRAKGGFRGRAPLLVPPWPEIVALAKRLINMPRGIGTHCGGIVIIPDPLYHIAPVQYSAKGFPIIQWEKDGTEAMGLVKIDLLGNRSLAVIRDAIGNIKGQGIPFDEHGWDPIHDPKTQEILAKGKTMGIFYVESPAMRLLQQKTGRGDFEHLVIHSSIIRPAANAYIREYIRRLKGGTYSILHPILKEVLAETYGIMVYQEDVVRVAMALAGFTFVEANQLQKIITKKDRHNKLKDFRQKFFSGAVQKGVDKEIIQQVWDMMLSFSGYSFCKPHSASYAQVSFQSAFLKAHYPAAFMAAVLSNYGGFYTTQAYISEAQRLGITVFTPDVNKSEKKFTAANHSIQVGFGQIKGLTEKAQDRILSTRCKDGAFESMEDFFTRAHTDESDAERLILAGACDHLSPELNRSQLLWKMRCFYQRGPANHFTTADFPSSPFPTPKLKHKRLTLCTQQSTSGGSPSSSVPDLKPYSKIQLLRSEYQMLGFLTSIHPISLAFFHADPNLIKAYDLRRHINKVVKVRGWWVTSRTVPTTKGDIMQFITFEDETDIFETVLFTDIYARYSKIFGDRMAFLFTGKVVENFGAIILEVKKIY